MPDTALAFSCRCFLQETVVDFIRARVVSKARDTLQARACKQTLNLTIGTALLFRLLILKTLHHLLKTGPTHVLVTMSDKGAFNREAIGDAGNLAQAVDPDRGGPQKTLYKPVATKGVEAQTVFAFLDRPPVVPPSQIEPHLPLPSQLTVSRPSEPRPMEYRVNESETRVPKWMQKSSEGARLAPAFNLEEAPPEDMPGGEGAAPGFERFQASLRAEGDLRGDGRGEMAELLRNVGGAGGGFPEQLDPLLGKGSLPAWLALERPKSSSGGKNSPGLQEGGIAAGKKGEGGGDKLGTADERLERQRMLARERRQKVNNLLLPSPNAIDCTRTQLYFVPIGAGFSGKETRPASTSSRMLLR